MINFLKRILRIHIPDGKGLCWCRSPDVILGCNDYCCGHRWTKGDWYCDSEEKNYSIFIKNMGRLYKKGLKKIGE